MSSEKSFIIKTFNDHFFEFFEDVLKILPNNMHIKTALRSFKTISDLNKSILVKCWHKFVYMKYTDVINTGDITFFFEKDYSSDLSNLSNSNKIMEIIVNYFDKEENEKEIKVKVDISVYFDGIGPYVVTYIQNLSKLSVAYVE